MDFTTTVKKISVSHGAGFVVFMLGEIMPMPDLPKILAAEKIDLTDDGERYSNRRGAIHF